MTNSTLGTQTVAALAGDKRTECNRAWERLWLLYSPRIHAMCRNWVRDWQIPGRARAALISDLADRFSEYLPDRLLSANIQKRGERFWPYVATALSNWLASHCRREISVRLSTRPSLEEFEKNHPGGLAALSGNQRRLLGCVVPPLEKGARGKVSLRSRSRGGKSELRLYAYAPLAESEVTLLLACFRSNDRRNREQIHELGWRSQHCRAPVAVPPSFHAAEDTRIAKIDLADTLELLRDAARQIASKYESSEQRSYLCALIDSSFDPAKAQEAVPNASERTTYRWSHDFRRDLVKHLGKGKND